MKDGLKALKAKLVVKEFKQIYGASELEKAEKKVDDTIDKLQADKKKKILNVKETVSAANNKKPNIVVPDKLYKAVGLPEVRAKIEKQEREKAKLDKRKPEKYKDIKYDVKRNEVRKAFAKIGAPLMDKREEFLKDKPSIQQKINELVKKHEKSPEILKAIRFEAKRADQEYDIGLLDMVMQPTIDRFHVLHEKLTEKIPEILELRLKQETLDIKDKKSNVVREAYDVGSTKPGRVNELFNKVKKEANEGTLPVPASKLIEIKELISDVDNLGKKNPLKKKLVNKAMNQEVLIEYDLIPIKKEYDKILLEVAEVYGDFKKLHNAPLQDSTKVVDISKSKQYTDELPSKTKSNTASSKSSASSNSSGLQTKANIKPKVKQPAPKVVGPLGAKNNHKLTKAIKGLAGAKVKDDKKQAIPTKSTLGHKKPPTTSINH